jgi:hypothetical protein
MDRDGGGAFLRTEVLLVERDRHQGVELGSRTTLRERGEGGIRAESG